MLFLVLLGELLVLYFLSRWVTKSIFTLFILIFRARSVAVSLLLVLQFPGTVVHELAHLFTAGILGVKTGKMKLEPDNIRENEITAGSVSVAVTDPFRTYAIGLAPIIWGMIIISAIAYFLPDVASKGDALRSWETWGLGYLLFAVSNAMFPSSVDLKGFTPFAIAIGISAGALYYLGFRFMLTGSALEAATRIATTLTQSLGIVLIINTALLCITTLITRLLVGLTARIRR